MTFPIPRLTRRIVSVAAALMLLSCPALAETITIDHASGRTEVERNPATVVVFDLGALETLDLLAVPVKGVPGSNIPPSLSRYKGDDYAKVGSLFEPDYETINALKPDLIIVGARMREHYAELSSLGPTIDLTLDAANAIGSVKRNAETLAHIFGKEAEISKHIAHLDTSVARLRQLSAGVGKGLVLLTTGGKISAYGKGSRFGELHDVFGIEPADPDLTVATHGQAVSYEYILEKNPDWLFVIDRDAAIGRSGQSAAALLDNALIVRTTAWARKQVVYLDPIKFYLTSSGIQSEQGIVDQLIAEFEAQ